MRVKDVSDSEPLVACKLQKAMSLIIGGSSAVQANCSSTVLISIRANFGIEVLLNDDVFIQKLLDGISSSS